MKKVRVLVDIFDYDRDGNKKYPPKLIGGKKYEYIRSLDVDLAVVKSESGDQCMVILKHEGFLTDD